MRLEVNLKTTMRARLLLPCIVFASLYLVPCVPANAYTLEGARWSGQPSPGACCAQITYRNLAGDSKDFNSGTQGAAAWNNSSALVWLSTSSAADINFQEANNSGVSWDGLTSWTTYTGGDGHTYFSPGMTVQVNNYYLKNYTAAKAQSVSAHEFGHALGLGHNSACVLMNPYTSTRYSSSCGYINVPVTDEVSGVNSLY
jgi:hypothetical protein